MRSRSVWYVFYFIISSAKHSRTFDWSLDDDWPSSVESHEKRGISNTDGHLEDLHHDLLEPMTTASSVMHEEKQNSPFKGLLQHANLVPLTLYFLFVSHTSKALKCFLYHTFKRYAMTLNLPWHAFWGRKGMRYYIWLITFIPHL